MTYIFEYWKLFLQKKVEFFFLIFFIVGFAGSITPLTRQLFVKLFPFAVILSFSAILLFQSANYSIKTITVLVLIGVLGFAIEVAGVNTHLIFGSYKYGNTLGIKLFNTPLLIGINWMMLSYSGSAIIENFPVPISMKIVFASLIMLIYDIFLEQLAPVLDMWHWDNNVVPVRNYVAWFLIALFLQTLIRFTGIKIQNSIASKIILMQVTFFISLIVFFKLTE
jgi:putative membrane protein